MKISGSLWKYYWDDPNDNITRSSTTRETTLKITDTKLSVPVVNLSTQDNAKLLQQLKSGFKRTGINIKQKYQQNFSRSK